MLSTNPYDVAMKFLDGRMLGKDRYVYWDAATGAYWVSTLEDIMLLGKKLMDARVTGCAPKLVYSDWCAETVHHIWDDREDFADAPTPGSYQYIMLEAKKEFDKMMASAPILSDEELMNFIAPRTSRKN